MQFSTTLATTIMALASVATAIPLKLKAELRYYPEQGPFYLYTEYEDYNLQYAFLKSIGTEFDFDPETGNITSQVKTYNYTLGANVTEHEWPWAKIEEKPPVNTKFVFDEYDRIHPVINDEKASFYVAKNVSDTFGYSKGEDAAYGVAILTKPVYNYGFEGLINGSYINVTPEWLDGETHSFSSV
ncbi:CYFA0S19e00669g1_1 [Cyberlindnera fabianii]|uniref:CYFA0S19e00669g1_1 n=1 Tax=Cyberlindnera fabianii TaxID=36022 RepID=A0A061B6P7_CYBFA|nr:CYFA0S19e00669g1_1 [Cyberlindnera fabianii]